MHNCQHRLLRRQIRKYLPSDLPAFIRAVDEAYQQFDDDHHMLERSLELSSRELVQANAEMRAILAGLPDLIMHLNQDGKIINLSGRKPQMFGFDPQQLLGVNIQHIPYPEVASKFIASIEKLEHNDSIVSIEYDLDVDDEVNNFEARLTRVPDTQFIIVIHNVTERKMMEMQLAQSQKLESIGQLAAGIAHEINTPAQYIGDNTLFLSDSLQDITTILDSFQQLLEASRGNDQAKELVDDIEEKLEEADLEYLLEEIPPAIRQSLDGIERISDIVSAMKTFSHPGTSERVLFDINDSIENSVAVSRHEWKYFADVVMDLDPSLPEIRGLPGEFNQAMLNLIVNAAHAIAERVEGTGKKGCITLGTRLLPDRIEVFVRDTGTGIPDEIISRIFDPFFTTKEVGKGTGQGLAIVHDVITKKHHGSISVVSVPGKNTTFKIQLPLNVQA